MLTLIETLRVAARNRVAYLRTVKALRDQSPATLMDAGRDQASLKELARAAVYGPKPYATPSYRADGLRYLTNPIHA